MATKIVNGRRVELTTEDERRLREPAHGPWQITYFDRASDQWVVEERDLAEVQAETRSVLRQEAETRLRPLLDAYNEPERLSWERQLSQARAFQADSSATTPLLDALASARGLTRSEMAGKIVTAANQFEQASGAILGVQQAAEDAAKNATTAEGAYKARNVTWPDI